MSEFMKKYILIQKIFTNEWEIGFLLQSWVEKTILGVETYWLFSKEKILGAAVSKEGHVDSLLEHERTNHSWLP